MTPTPTTRASLLFRLRDSQDHEAWVEFVEIYEPAVYRQLRRCGLQDADARELMQELFLAVNRQVPKWELAKERGSFRGWLRRVTRNLVINWMKHGQRRMLAFGGTESQSLFDELAADDCPESAEFDFERSSFDVSASFRTRPAGAKPEGLASVLGHHCRREKARSRRSGTWDE